VAFALEPIDLLGSVGGGPETRRPVRIDLDDLAPRPLADLMVPGASARFAGFAHGLIYGTNVLIRQ